MRVQLDTKISKNVFVANAHLMLHQFSANNVHTNVLKRVAVSYLNRIYDNIAFPYLFFLGTHF